MKSIGQMIENAGRTAKAFDRRVTGALLLGLCLVAYLPGLLRLPPVDRTEVVFAETTRSMVERGAWLDPRYAGTVHQFRPIGTFWAQGLAAYVAPDAQARDIRVYRLPGFIAAVLTVLAIYWLATPLVGSAAAGLAAGLFAVAPLTVLLSQLAIADGLALLPATVAMLALLRLYAAQPSGGTWALALLFWSAAGLGMLVNALHTPILVTVTLIALFVMDRDLSWLRRLHVLAGLPLALALAAPWIYVRFLQDGVPFAGLSFDKFLAALGGAQDMKLRAFPGTFLLAALLGFLPGTALLAPAIKRLWQNRDTARVARFLLAWIIGYIVYLEALSSKPGTYTVQVMFPAMALAVAMLVGAGNGKGAAPGWHAIPWPPLAALFALALFASPYGALQQWPPAWLAVPVIAVAGLFYWSAREGRAGRLRVWAQTGIAALALFAVTLLGLVLPAIDSIWPARQISRALEGCAPGPVSLHGFREPSGSFAFGSARGLETPEEVRTALVEGRPGYIAGEVRDPTLTTLNRSQYRRLKPLACVEAYNVMRGCPLFFTIVATGPVQSCAARGAFPCTGGFLSRSAAAKERKGCD